MIDYILQRYLEIVAKNYLENATIKTNGKINFRCNICGDSAQKRSKRRGWFIEKDTDILFHCFNCFKTMPAKYWLKKYYPSYYYQYINETVQSKETFIVKKKIEKPKEVKTEKYAKDFESLTKDHGKFLKRARDFCIKRKIPENEWKKWYVCQNITSNKYRDRIIIPFKKEEKLVWFQARSVDGQLPKYQNSISSVNNAFDVLYEKLDKTKPVIVVEGYIDSLFIDNCIAAFSYNWSDEIKKKLDCVDDYYIVDYDFGNKQTAKICDRLLKNGKSIFNWNKYIKKLNLPNRNKWDINDLYLYLNRDKQFCFDDFKQYFTNNYMDKVYFL